MKNLGKNATDKITGFKGIVTAKAMYLYGCAQYLLTPPVDSTGKRQEGEWFDEGRQLKGIREYGLLMRSIKVIQELDAQLVSMEARLTAAGV